jgi:hypothetical protein
VGCHAKKHEAGGSLISSHSPASSSTFYDFQAALSDAHHREVQDQENHGQNQEHEQQGAPTPALRPATPPAPIAHAAIAIMKNTIASQNNVPRVTTAA